MSEHDILEMQAFKAAVQKPDHRGKKLDETAQSSLLHQSVDSIATQLGVSKGLIRVHAETLSGTQKYAKSMNYFGNDDDDNPAKRQRLKREQTAQRAIATARAVIAAREQAAAGAPADTVSTLLNRFSSGGKQS